MLLSTEQRDTQIIGGGASSKFSFAINGKAFKIMIDGLYSNKEGAVVRELWTNAFDSHVMAGTSDRPFECHLPTTYEPYFSVRDFGVGMSHAFMMDGYTRVFHSTKDNSNEQVGALGLGRMSPFSKTDTFTLTSWTEGVERVYSVFLDNNRIPTVTLMHEAESAEPSGVEVNIAVAPVDFNRFKEAVTNYIIGFNVIPHITGVSTQFHQPENTIFGEGWRMFKAEGVFDALSDQAFAKQGCVVYPIDADSIDGLTDAQRSLCQTSLIIDFNIGDLDITASRESLSYDAATQTAIKQRLQHVEKEICAAYQGQIDAAPTMWRAYIALNQIAKTLPAVLAAVIKSTLRWRGREVVRQIQLNDELLRDGTDRVQATYLSQTDLSSGKYSNRRTKVDWSPTRYITVYPGSTVVFFEDIEHLVHKGAQRIRHWHDFTVTSDQTVNVLWLRGKPGSIGMLRMLAKLGRPEIRMLADLPKIKRDANLPPKTKTQMKRLNKKGQWENTTVFEEDANIYVNLHKRDIYKDDVKWGLSESYLVVMRDRLVEAGLLSADVEIIGVPSTHRRVPVRNAETWKTFWSVVEEALTQFDKTAYINHRQWKSISQDTDFAARLGRSVIERGGLHYPTRDLGKVVTMLDEAATNAEANKVNELLGRVYTTYSDTSDMYAVDLTEKFRVLCDNVSETYPLLKDLSWRDVNSEKREVIMRYVNLIDADDHSRESVQQDLAA